MFKALLWKEWRQLALVRWGGFALGALLPVAFNTGAELAKRGLLPTGRVSEYAPRDLLFEVLPAALALGLWPLIALMSASQAFAADRAAGTESFLLERPVARGTVWRARIVAALGTLFVVILATAALGVLVAALAGAPPKIGWIRWQAWSAGGAGVALLSFLGGMIAASLLTSPMAAVLGGAVLAGIPVLLAAQLSTAFTHARYAGVPVGLVLPVVLLPAYVVASWSATCRGEPAGRGRVRRGVTVVAASLAGVLALFAILAPLAVRADAGAGTHFVVADPSGKSAFVGGNGRSGEGGWIIDVASGRRREFVAPPVQTIAWSPDGSELAVVTWAGALGGQRREPRIDIRRAGDGRVDRSFAMSEMLVSGLVWAKDGLVVRGHRFDSPVKGDYTIDVLDPRSGSWRSTGFTSETWGTLDGSRADGRVFLRLPIYHAVTAGASTYRGFELMPIDVREARVGRPLADASGGPLQLGGWAAGLSPTGRYALVPSGDPARGLLRVKALENGDDPPPVEIPRSAHWLSGDRLVWHEDLDRRTRLFTMVPGSPPVAVREWTDGQVGIEPGPNGASIFVSVLPAGGAPPVDATRPPPEAGRFDAPAPAGVVPEEGVYRAAEDRWISVAVFSGRQSDLRYTQWAAAETLARVAPGVVYLEEVEPPGARRFVLGGPGDLR